MSTGGITSLSAPSVKTTRLRFEELMVIGKSMELTGEDLQEFVLKQLNLEKEGEEFEREVRREELEHEQRMKEFEDILGKKRKLEH